MSVTYNIPESFSSALNFQVTLDGAGYAATVAWNAYGQRPYITITDQYGRRILTLPLIGSPQNTTYTYENLTAGFTQTYTYKRSDFVETSQDKTVVLALIKPINIIAGYFSTSTMYYYPQDQLLVVGP